MKNFLHSFSRKRWQSQSDEELIAHYQRTGDEAPAGELFNRYVHLVYGICRQYFGQREDCRDVAMAAFEQMLLSINNAPIGHFNSWLFTVTRNYCISQLRKSAREGRYHKDWENIKKSAPQLMENDGFARLYYNGQDERMSGHSIEAAILQLEEKQQKCIRLFYFDKKSYKEIAQSTGFQLSEVKSYLQNGKRRLRAILEKHGQEHEQPGI